jgi:hypothetical protein
MHAPGSPEPRSRPTIVREIAYATPILIVCQAVWMRKSKMPNETDSTNAVRNNNALMNPP